MAWKFRHSDMNLHDPYKFLISAGKKKTWASAGTFNSFRIFESSDNGTMESNHGSMFHVAASSQTQGTHLQLLKEQGKNGSTVERQGLKFVQPNKQNHSELKVIDSCMIVWRRVEVLIGWVFYSARGFFVRLFIACLSYVIIVARTSIVFDPNEKTWENPPEIPTATKSLQTKLHFGTFRVWIHHLYNHIYNASSSHVLPMLPHQGFSHPQKKPAVYLGPLGAPLRSKIPDPEPLQSWTVARYQGPANSSWWTPGLVVSGQ